MWKQMSEQYTRSMEATVDPPCRRRKQRKDIKHRGTTTTILELPSHISCEILSRLPLKSIFNCKRVCSSFRNLTLDPYFAQLQLPRSSLCIILYRTSDIGYPMKFGFLPLQDSLVNLRRRRATMKFETQIEIPGSNLCLVSCNGLICLSNYNCSNVYVCNPITRQHFRLPEFKNKPSFMNERHYFSWCGIGCNRSADLFKVVKIIANLRKRPFEMHWSICTLGVDDEWRTLDLGDAQRPFPLIDIVVPFHQSSFVFFNGAFHWIHGETSMLSLCYFDVEKEQCGELPSPYLFSGSGFSGYGFYLGVLDNCLYIRDENTSSVSVNIWVMKDYGNIGSWTLEWIIQRPLPRGLKWNLEPVKTFEDGTVLMVVGNKTLASYNPVSTVLEKITYHGVKFWGGSITGVPSFLPLP